MPEDLKFPFEFDDTGDAASVEDDDFYMNHAMILGLIAADEQAGQGIQNAADATGLESDIESVFTASPYFEAPVNATVTSVSADGTIEVEVDAFNLSTYEIEV